MILKDFYILLTDAAEGASLLQQTIRTMPECLLSADIASGFRRVSTVLLPEAVGLAYKHFPHTEFIQFEVLMWCWLANYYIDKDVSMTMVHSWYQSAISDAHAFQDQDIRSYILSNAFLGLSRLALTAPTNAGKALAVLEPAVGAHCSDHEMQRTLEIHALCIASATTDPGIKLQAYSMAAIWVATLNRHTPSHQYLDEFLTCMSAIDGLDIPHNDTTTILSLYFLSVQRGRRSETSSQVNPKLSPGTQNGTRDNELTAR